MADQPLYAAPNKPPACGGPCPLDSHTQAMGKLKESLQASDKMLALMVEDGMALGFAVRAARDMYRMGYANREGLFPDGEPGDAAKHKGKLAFDDVEVLKKLGLPENDLQGMKSKFEQTRLYEQAMAFHMVHVRRANEADDLTDKVWGLFLECYEHLLKNPAHNQPDAAGLTDAHKFFSGALLKFEMTRRGKALLDTFVRTLADYQIYQEIQALVTQSDDRAVQDVADLLIANIAHSTANYLQAQASAANQAGRYYDVLNDPEIIKRLGHVESLAKTKNVKQAILDYSGLLSGRLADLAKAERFSSNALKELRTPIDWPAAYVDLRNGVRSFCMFVATISSAMKYVDNLKRTNTTDSLIGFARLVYEVSNTINASLYGVADIWKRQAPNTPCNLLAPGYRSFLTISVDEFGTILARTTLALAVLGLIDASYQLVKEWNSGDSDQFFVKVGMVGASAAGAAGALLVVWGYAATGWCFMGIGAIAGLAVGLIAWYVADHPCLKWLENLPWGKDGRDVFKPSFEYLEREKLFLYQKNQPDLFKKCVYDDYYKAVGEDVTFTLVSMTPGNDELRVLLGNPAQPWFNLAIDGMMTKRNESLVRYETSELHKDGDGAYIVTRLYERYDLKLDGQTQYKLTISYTTRDGHRIAAERTVTFSAADGAARFVRPLFATRHLGESIVHKDDKNCLVYELVKGEGAFLLTPKVALAQGTTLVVLATSNGRRIAEGSWPISGQQEQDVAIAMRFLETDPLGSESWIPLSVTFHLVRDHGLPSAKVVDGIEDWDGVQRLVSQSYATP